MLRKFRAAVRNRESGGNDLNENSEQRKFKLKVKFWDICYVKEEFTENASSKTALGIRLSSTHLSEDLTGLVEKIVNSANRNNELRRCVTEVLTQGANEKTYSEEGWGL